MIIKKVMPKVTGAARGIILSTEKSSVGSVVLLLCAGLIRADLDTTRRGTAKNGRKGKKATAA